MDSKTLHVLEYPKILARLADICDFSASAEMARLLQPTPDYDEALLRLAETSEARTLLVTSDLTIGGAHDIRQQVDLAAHGGVLDPKELLDVQTTLVSMRNLQRFFSKHAEASPHLADIACRLPAPIGLIEAISRCIADNGEVADSASPKLYDLRRQVRIAHDRLMTRLQRYLTDSATASKLQDAVITQRDGRYVIPLRVEFKGQVKAIVHDQSSTGATLFVEPLAVVELNNAFREAQIAERDEVRRVLAELSAQVGELAGEIVPGVAALAELDLAFAKAKYADEIHANEPILLKMDDRRRTTDHGKSPVVNRQYPPGTMSSIHLLNARHPLLDPETVVPITIDAAPGTFALVITGPNTGGKTVTLKTVGLLAVMAQSGLHIPAQSGSELPCFQAVYADIGDEQSIEQSLSTFSGHITNIVHILKKADNRSLVILDELGAGTDPQEGAALARAILSSLLAQGITTFVATHYPELKTFAHTTPGVVNASLEFNVQTLRPTYKLTIGLPGRSNALAIAQSLGLPQEIIEAAKSEINPDDLRADKLIGDIHRQRKIAFKESEKAGKARSEARRLEHDLAERLEKIEYERQKVLEQARAEGELEIEVLKAQLKSLKAELKKAHLPLDALKEIEEKVEVFEEEIQKPVKRRMSHVERSALHVKGRTSQGPLKVGEKVILKRLGNEGTIISLDEDEAEIMAGALRMRIPLEELKRKENESSAVSGQSLAKKQPAESSAVRRASSVLASSPGIELDLRGQRAEDALEMLDRYIEKATMAGLPFVRIIHGKGTGKLRQEVRAALKDHPNVLSFEEGGDKEGGAGVTVAKLSGE
ncbi:MAG: endonuclease MutS2 [Chloroflexi bacterium]|nr:endonuclease MutS2 [Chloroflexota bacterium]